MIGRFEVFCPTAECKTEAREHCDNFSAFAFIPAIATTVVPHRPGHLLVNVGSVFVFGIKRNFDDLLVSCLYIFNTIHNVVHL